MRRRRGWLFAAATVSLLGAACGSTEPAASGGATAAGGVAASISISAPPTTVAQDFDPNATFTWAYSVDNTSFDPDKITTNNSYMYLFPIYDALVFANEEAELEPMLATGWDLSPDGTQLTMKLVEGYSFHDGEPFNAAAVKANIERSKTLPGSYNAKRLASVSAVEVVDEHTVRFVTTEAAAPLIGILSGSAGMMMSPAAFDKPGEDLAPTGGSGAYRMTNYVKGQSVEYTRNDDYYAPDQAKVAKMVFIINGDDNARLNAVISGQADTTFLRPAMVKPAQDAGLVIRERPSLTVYHLMLNTARSEFDDKRVRQAIAYAIDRDAIAQLTGGLCTPNSSVFADFYWAGNPEAAKRYNYDPDKARALLAEAGLPDGFSFTLAVVNLASWVQLAELIQQYLAAVGIEMTIATNEVQRIVADFTVDKTVDAQLTEQKGESDPSVITSQFFLAGGSSNPGGYTTAEVTQLHEDALRGATTEARSEVYKKLVATVTEEAYPNISLCQITVPFASNDKVQGVPIPADGSRWFRGVSIKAS